MLIRKQQLSQMLLSVVRLWQKNIDLFGDIDSRFGDGDHGVTIGKIAAVIALKVEGWCEESIHDFMEDLGTAILGISGGSATPLYGTLIGGLADALGEENEIDGILLKRMLRSCQEAMFEITSAKVGDKTMMDALIPAVEAAQRAENHVSDILLAADKAAAEGAAFTAGIASKFGRARSYGDKTVGTPDVGALSTAILFQGLYEGLAIQE